MNDQLFKNVDYKSDPHWVVKEFFNSVYQQEKFLWVLPLLVGRKGCGVNEEFCFFPNLNDPDPTYHFSGVTFGTMGEETIVTDEQFNAYLKDACDLYLRNRPADESLVARALDGSSI